MILVLEGAPATGKSTTAKALEQLGAMRIAEVNERVPRTGAEPPDWYLEQQLLRWAEATDSRARTILDGDILQPVWFNWIYPGRIPSSWQTNLNFFRRNLHRFGVPDRYVYLWISESERAARETARSLARGRSEAAALSKVEKYRTMQPALQAYFTALGQTFPGLVQIQQADKWDPASLLDGQPPAGRMNPGAVLDFIESWLDSNDPEEFLPAS